MLFNYLEEESDASCMIPEILSSHMPEFTGGVIIYELVLIFSYATNLDAIFSE
jgi:hypothetical protein